MRYGAMFADYNYFEVNVKEYDSSHDFTVTRAASLNYPKNNAVMFIIKQYMDKADVFSSVENCLIFWPENVNLPKGLEKKHAIVFCEDPHLEYCRFFQKHNITNFIPCSQVKEINRYLVAGNVEIGKGTKIFPYVYMNGNIHIGENCYIAAGARIIGNVYIGNHVLIKENAVIGADGLSTDRDTDGSAVTMPQFGGVVIEDDVQIGANSVIARGAIDNTVISRGCKIDNSVYVSHNAFLGENVFMCGESHTFGSVTVGRNTQISGNAAVRDGLTVGEGCLVGAGAMVTRNVKDNTVVSGNPAREMLFPR